MILIIIPQKTADLTNDGFKDRLRGKRISIDTSVEVF
jgi:hypothetical protein